MSRETDNKQIKTNSWDAFASVWDTEPSVTAFDQQAKALLTELTTTLTDKDKDNCAPLSLLDFGCATGRIVMHMAPLYQTIAAVDLSQKMIDVVNEKKKITALLNKRIHTYAGDLLTDAPSNVPDVFEGPFNVIYSGSVLTFCADPRAVLENLYKRLAPKGLMIHAVWKLPEEGSIRDYTKGFSKSELCQELEAVGLKDVYIYKNDITVGD
eukprot:Awhi_evm1s1864